MPPPQSPMVLKTKHENYAIPPLLTVRVASVTDVAPLVTVSTVGVEFIIAVESLAAETTLRVALETTLVNGARFVVTVLLMLAQFFFRKEGVFMGEYFLIAGAEVTTKFEVSGQIIKNHPRLPSEKDLPHDF